MELEMPDGTKVKRQFKVSGFYRDYIDISINVPKIYVSEAFLQETDIPLFPADRIIARQGTVESGAQIEQWVYSDIDMEYDSQRQILYSLRIPGQSSCTKRTALSGL